MITKDEWDRIEIAIKSGFRAVSLVVDGYNVKLCLERVGAYELGIVVYINGMVDWTWLMGDCEERRRFYRRSTRSLLTKAEKDALKKVSKKYRDKCLMEANATYDVYYHYWQSFRALKKHLLGNNKDVQLVSIT